MPRPFKESLLGTAAWHPDQVDAYHSSLLLQKQLLHSQKGCIVPEYVERSGNLIYIRSAPTPMRPISRFSIDWPGHPSQLIIMSVTILASLTKIHAIGSLHRNLCEDSIYIDTNTSEIALLTYGDVSQRLETSPVDSFVPQIMEKETLANLCLNHLPLTYALEAHGKSLLHPNQLRQYLAIPSPERMKVSARFSILVDLYQFGTLVYNLITGKAAPNPFATEYSGPEGWARARREVLDSISLSEHTEKEASSPSSRSLGPAFSEFLLRLLVLSDLPPYYSAYEAHSDLVGIWKAAGQRIAKLPEVTSLPRPSQSAEKLCAQMLSTRVPFYDLQLQRVLRHAMALLPPQLLELLHPRSCSEVRFDSLQVGPPCLMDGARTLEAIRKHRTMMGSLSRDVSRMIGERLVRSLQGDGRVVSVSGKKLGGKTSFLADFITYSTTQLNACCVYVPLRGIPAAPPPDFFSPDRLYTCDSVLSTACDAESGSRRCLVPVGSCHPLYLGEQSVTNPGRHEKIHPSSMLHIVALYLVEALSLLGCDAIQHDIAAELAGRYPELLARLPSLAPRLAIDLGLRCSPQVAFFSEDLLADLIIMLIEVTLRYVPMFVLVLDDLNGSENKPFLRKLWGILQSKRIGRTVVMIAENETPVLNLNALRFVQTQASAQGPNSPGSAGVNQESCPLTARLFGTYFQGTKPVSALQLDPANSPQTSQDDTRSLLSVGSDGCQSVLSIKSTASSARSGSGPAPQARAQEAVVKTYTFASAARRQLSVLNVVIGGMTEEQAEYFLFKSVGIQSTAKGLTRQHQKDFVLPLYRRTMGVMGLLKRLVLTLYSYSALFLPAKYDRGALELLPGDDEMTVRQFLLLKEAGKLSQRDLDVLYSASVFGQAFSTTWVADSLGVTHEGVFSSCTNLSSEDIHLLSYAPENLMLRRGSGGAIGKQGQHAPYAPYTPYAPYAQYDTGYSQSECVFTFTNDTFRRILLENFLSDYSFSLLKVGLYLRSVWLSSRLILEPQDALIPPVYVGALGPQAVSELQSRLPEEFHTVLASQQARGKTDPGSLASPASPVSPAFPSALSLNLKAPALQLATRSSKSKLFEEYQRDGVRDRLWPDAATLHSKAEARSAGIRSNPFTSLVSYATDDERYVISSQSTGLVVTLSTVCSYLNALFPQLTDIFDQLELLRLNAYSASIYAKSACDISPYVEYASKAQNEVFGYMSLIFLNPDEHGSYSLSFYKQLCQNRLMFSEGKNQDGRKLISDKLFELFTIKNVTTGLESVATALGLDVPSLLQNPYLLKITALHNAVPVLLASLSHSLCLLERVLQLRAGRERRIATSSKLIQDGNLVYRTAWLEVLYFVQTSQRLQDHPVRASLIVTTLLEQAMQMLREGVADEVSPFCSGFDAHAALRALGAQQTTPGILPGAIGSGVDASPVYDTQDQRSLFCASQQLLLLLFDEQALSAIRRDSALGRAYSRWKVHGTFTNNAPNLHSATFEPYAILRLLPLASEGERIVQRLLFLLCESAFARVNQSSTLAVCVGMLERMYRYGCTPEAFAIAAVLANIQACACRDYGVSGASGASDASGATASDPGSSKAKRDPPGPAGAWAAPTPFKSHFIHLAVVFCHLLEDWARSIDTDGLEAPVDAFSGAAAQSLSLSRRADPDSHLPLPGMGSPYLYYESTGRYYASADVDKQEAALRYLQEQQRGLTRQGTATLLGQDGAGQALYALARLPVLNTHFQALRLYASTATLLYSAPHTTSNLRSLVSALQAGIGDCGRMMSQFDQACGQAFGQYAYLRFVCSSTASDYISLAQQCQTLYNHLISINEATYSPLVYTVWSCSKGLARQRLLYGMSAGASLPPDFSQFGRKVDPEEELRAGITAAFFAGTQYAGCAECADLASSGELHRMLGIPAPSSEGEARAFTQLAENLRELSFSFPLLEDIVDLASIRSDSSLLPVLITTAVLLEANARVGNLAVALSLAKIVHCFGIEVTTLGCFGALVLSRAALITAAAASEISTYYPLDFTVRDEHPTNLVEATLEHTICSIYSSYGPYGVFSRMLETLQGCLALHRGVCPHKALRTIYSGLDDDDDFLRLEQAYAVFGSTIVLAAPLVG